MKREQLINGATEFFNGLGKTLDSQEHGASKRLYNGIRGACAAGEGARLAQKVHLYTVGQIFLELLKGEPAYKSPSDTELQAAERDPIGKPEADAAEEPDPPLWEP
jgi:hypothetical protein